MVYTRMSSREWARRSLALSARRLMYTQQISVGFPNYFQKGRIMVKSTRPAVQGTVSTEKVCYSSQADGTRYSIAQLSTAQLTSAQGAAQAAPGGLGGRGSKGDCGAAFKKGSQHGNGASNRLIGIMSANSGARAAPAVCYRAPHVTAWWGGFGGSDWLAGI